MRTLKDRLADFIRDTRADRMDPAHHERKAGLLAELAFTTPAIAAPALKHSISALGRAIELRRRRSARGALPW